MGFECPLLIAWGLNVLYSRFMRSQRRVPVAYCLNDLCFRGTMLWSFVFSFHEVWMVNAVAWVWRVCISRTSCALQYWICVGVLWKCSVGCFIDVSRSHVTTRVLTTWWCLSGPGLPFSGTRQQITMSRWVQTQRRAYRSIRGIDRSCDWIYFQCGPWPLARSGEESKLLRNLTMLWQLHSSCSVRGDVNNN